MKKIIILLSLFAITSSAALAAIYVKIPDIDGESERAGYEGWIEVTGMQQHIYRDTSARTGRGRSRAVAHVEPIDIIKELDKSSPYLTLAVLQGKVFNDIEIHFTSDDDREQGSDVFLKYTLSNVAVVAYEFSADQEFSANEESRPRESFSLNFEKIKIVYIEQGDGDSAGAEHEITYDIAAGV
ncbi:MAG: Hcp family type VI secretion system effector [Opitutaceae bacterium]